MDSPQQGTSTQNTEAPASAVGAPDDSTTISILCKLMAYLVKLGEGFQGDPLMDKAESLLVVASLIAAATFQAALDIPSSILEYKVTKSDVSCDNPLFAKPYGDVIRNCRAYRINSFMAYNTASFFSSVLLIFFSHRPALAGLLLEISVSSLIITYLFILVAVSPSVATDLSLIGFYYVTISLIGVRLCFRALNRSLFLRQR